MQIEVIKINKTTNNAVAIKIMDLSDWVKFDKLNKDYFYKAYMIGFSQFKIIEK